MFCMKIFEAFEWDEHRVSCFRVNKQVFDGMPVEKNTFLKILLDFIPVLRNFV